MQSATRSLNAFIRRDYAACVAAAAEVPQQLLSTLGLVTIVALRRQGRLDAAEQLGSTLLQQGNGMGGHFLLFMMLLDGALDPGLFLRERFFSGVQLELTAELECQVNFYWGAKLLTEGENQKAIGPLRRAVEIECNALERTLAQADLDTAEAAT